VAIDESTSTMLNDIHKFVKEMESLWDQIHMDVTTREYSLDLVFNEMRKLMNALGETEKRDVHDVGIQIAKVRLELEVLNNTLGLSQFDESKYHPGSINLV
jgi:hypothetical protein